MVLVQSPKYTILFLSLLPLACLSPLIPERAQIETIYEFPNHTWVENLAIRPNGNVLVTLVNVPEVWEIDPCAKGSTPRKVYSFPKAISVSGIVEYSPDVFAVNVGNFSLSTGGIPGSWSVWSLNLTGLVEVKKITDISSAILLNGMTSLPARPSTILSADSGTGEVYAIDTCTNEYDVAAHGPFLQPNRSAALRIGVNGIQFRPGNPTNMYFDNSFRSPSFAYLPINPDTGRQTGSDDIVFSHAIWPGNNGFAADDFTFDTMGEFAYLTTDPSDSLVKVDMTQGTAEVLVGGKSSSELVGPTACRFGRTNEDAARGRLYVTTNGGLANPPPSGLTGGRLVAYNTR